MKLISHLLLVLTVTLVTACGGDSQVSQSSDIMGEITAVLKDVTDADSAEAAKAKLKPLMAKMTELSTGDPEAAAKMIADMSEADAKKFSDATTAYATELTRIMSNPALGEKLSSVLSGN